ncbi:hypothetical protein HJG60_010567 [Phyllostomus discolor]|uniref:Uncharacterized protein n=1 Tax=Phyllostomus discolor TaxID=89673 RepID=A0A834AND6_9CHIR|nr:hypothetical protein HJG60_010567 [Phyllostomus discolor]
MHWLGRQGSQSKGAMQMLSKGHLLKVLYLNSEAHHSEQSSRLRGHTVDRGVRGAGDGPVGSAVCAAQLTVLAQVPHTAQPLSFSPGGEQTVSEASALDPHQCPSHQAPSSPSPENFLCSLPFLISALGMS